ncbi:MAG: 50S ribosomal protein L1 [Nitrososphaerota archaeon]
MMQATTTKLLEAIKKAKEQAGERKLRQSMEMIINIKGVDLSKPENRFTDSIEMPNDLGPKRRKICVIASGNLAVQASRIEGVQKVLQKEDLELLIGRRREAKKLASQYDFFLVEPSMMGLAARALGAALGARGKTPVPIPPGQDLEKLVRRYINTVVVQLRKISQVSCLLGLADESDEKLASNAEAILNRVVEKMEKRMRNVGSIYFKTTMGKPVKVNI